MDATGWRSITPARKHGKVSSLLMKNARRIMPGFVEDGPKIRTRNGWEEKSRRHFNQMVMKTKDRIK
jgi:hypothetical protein